MLNCEFFNDAGVDKVRYGYDLGQGATVNAVTYLAEKEAATYGLIRKRYEAWAGERAKETAKAEAAEHAVAEKARLADVAQAKADERQDRADAAAEARAAEHQVKPHKGKSG